MLRPYVAHITTLHFGNVDQALDHMPTKLDLANFVLRQAQDERGFCRAMNKHLNKRPVLKYSQDVEAGLRARPYVLALPLFRHLLKYQ
jgi:hypothetical protein